MQSSLIPVSAHLWVAASTGWQTSLRFEVIRTGRLRGSRSQRPMGAANTGKEKEHEYNEFDEFFVHSDTVNGRCFNDWEYNNNFSNVTFFVLFYPLFFRSFLLPPILSLPFLSSTTQLNLLIFPSFLCVLQFLLSSSLIMLPYIFPFLLFLLFILWPPPATTSPPLLLPLLHPLPPAPPLTTTRHPPKWAWCTRACGRARRRCLWRGRWTPAEPSRPRTRPG